MITSHTAIQYLFVISVLNGIFLLIYVSILLPLATHGHLASELPKSIRTRGFALWKLV